MVIFCEAGFYLTIKHSLCHSLVRFVQYAALYPRSTISITGFNNFLRRHRHLSYHHQILPAHCCCLFFFQKPVQ